MGFLKEIPRVFERYENGRRFFLCIFTSDIFERESTSQPTVNIEETIENSEVVKVFDAGTDAMCDVES